MKRIEDIKEFKDIDTYYEISKIVEEVFQDRVEAHKHLVTANKEIESQKRVINGMIDNEEQYCLEINKLKNIIDNAIEETKLGIQILQETKENYPNINCDVVINKYLKPIYKALKDSDKND